MATRKSAVWVRYSRGEITVKAHRGQVMRKMNAGSVAEVVNMAVKLHLAAAAKP
jgi:FixJ family two-component response regulator